MVAPIITTLLCSCHTVSKLDELDTNVNLDNTNLESVKHTRFLGMLIEDCFPWKNHIDCVSKTISQNIGVMNKLKHFVPTCTLHCLHWTGFALFELWYTYGDTCKSYNKLIKLVGNENNFK